MQRHLRASSFAAAPESCAMKGSFVRFLPRHSNSGCRVCHLAEAAHGIQGVDAKSIVVVRFRRSSPQPHTSKSDRIQTETGHLDKFGLPPHRRTRESAVGIKETTHAHPDPIISAF